MSKLILFEDEHLLAVNKPSGVNTHKPDRFAQDGIYEWLCKRGSDFQSRVANEEVAVKNRSHGKLSILHRLDKDTSGVMIFGKTPQANQSLARQFESHRVEKTYALLAAARPRKEAIRAQSEDAVTEFKSLRQFGKFFLLEARPITGKTHQVRRHAQENGFPIVGDTLYGGITAPRLMLHARRIALEHPAGGKRVAIEAPLPKAFGEMDAMFAAREFRELFLGEETNVFRLVSGSADGFPDVVVDSYAGKLLVQWQSEEAAEKWRGKLGEGHEQFITKQNRTKPIAIDGGEQAQQQFLVRENGLNFIASFGEGFSTGIFPDQRENRCRLLSMNLAGKTVLNCFAYTCAFSVAAAKAGATVTSVDLSKSYLEWGKENFRANDLNPDAHDFIYGDVFSWLKRFGKRGRKWDVVLLDPPTFSTTKQGKVFRAAKDYRELAELAIPLVERGGILFCSTNQRTLAPEKFEKVLRESARSCGREVATVEFETQPFDFRVAPGEKPYLQTFWMQLL